MKHEEIYIITDGCMWEANKQNGTYYPHSIEVVNSKTGQVRYIKSGARIAFIEGEITQTRDQETYNQETSQMSCNEKGKLPRTSSKRTSKKSL